jgi:hypothetical protein
VLKSFKSVNFDLAVSDIQKFAAACLLAALLPVQGHAASALSKQPGSIGQGIPQTESAAQGNSKQNMLDQESAGAAKPNAPGAASGKRSRQALATMPMLSRLIRATRADELVTQ